MGFCRYCGSKLSETGAFCENCGKPVNVMPKPSATKTEEFMAKRDAQRAEVTRQKSTKKKRPFLRFTAFAMVVTLIITAFFKPGFLRKKHTPEDDYDYASKPFSEGLSDSSNPSNDPYYDMRIVDEDYEIVVGDFDLEQVASGEIDSENNTISSSDVSLSVDPLFLDEATSATIEKATSEVICDMGGVEVPLTIVDCKANGVTEDSLVNISMRISCGENERVAAGYIDESGVMHPIPYTYNRNTGILTITSTHLSKYCGFPVENDRMSNAMLSYVFVDEMFNGSEDTDIKSISDYIESTVQSPEDLSNAMILANGLSDGNFVVGNLNSAFGLYDGMISSAADGAGSWIFTQGNIGTVGEIMNTNFGKAGTWMVKEMKFGPELKAANINDKFASSYPSEFLRKSGMALNRLNLAVSVFKIGDTVLKEGWRSQDAASSATKTLIETCLFKLGESVNWSSYGLNVYLLGVSLLSYSLDQFATTATEGRKQVYISAYQKYYQTKGTDGGYRSAATWREKFNNILENGGGTDEVEAEIDSYVNEFWKKADQMDAAYLDSLLTEDDKAALGAAAQGGLNEQLKKSISDSYKADLREYIANILRVMNEQKKTKMIEQAQEDYDLFALQMNQVVTVRIVSDYTGRENSLYDGCIVRFKDIEGKVDDPAAWQTILNSEGSGSLKFTLLGHMMANAGTTLEIVRRDGDLEEIIDTKDFVFKEDNSGKYTKLYAVMMLHEDHTDMQDPQAETADGDNDIYYEEPEENGQTSDSKRPVKYVYYSDYVERKADCDYSSAIRVPLAKSLEGSVIDISDGTFTIRGLDSSFHQGREDVLKMMAEELGVQSDDEMLSASSGSITNFSMDSTVSNIEIIGSLYQDNGFNAPINIDSFHADVVIDRNWSGYDEDGSYSEDTHCDLELHYDPLYAQSNDTYLYQMDIDGQERWVIELVLVFTAEGTSKTHEVESDGTRDYDDDFLKDYVVKVLYVGE